MFMIYTNVYTCAPICKLSKKLVLIGTLNGDSIRFKKLLVHIVMN